MTTDPTETCYLCGVSVPYGAGLWVTLHLGSKRAVHLAPDDYLRWYDGGPVVKAACKDHLDGLVPYLIQRGIVGD